MHVWTGFALAAFLAANVASLDGASAASVAPGENYPVATRAIQPSRDADASCLRAKVALVKDSVPDSANFEPAPCDAKNIARVWRHDRSSDSTRVAQDISAGEIVPSFPEFGGEVVRPGQMLQLVVTVGNVRVAREVEAMQTARPGQRLFVKSRDGQILSVSYEVSPQ